MKGKKTGGRRKGTPNHVTSAARTAFLAVFGKLEKDLEGWIRETASGVERPLEIGGVVVLGKDDKPLTYRHGADPGKAADLVLRMAEYHYPKLSRAEVTGKDGGAVSIEIVKVAAPAPTNE